MKLPIAGPLPDSPAWHEARFTGIFASEGAAACGLSDERQPLDIYLEKCRLKEPFEGNEFTRRGKRFEQFLATEYMEQTGHPLRTGLPMYFSPDYPVIGATPDAVRADNALHGCELKNCHWRRAGKLGPEGSDEVFTDWVVQCQQQMLVMGWELVDVFVMVDLHTYRLFTVERNELLIAGIIEAELALWDRIQRRDPPPPNWNHAGTPALIRGMYGVNEIETVMFTADDSKLWLDRQRNKDQIKVLEAECAVIESTMLHKMGNAAVGKFPLGQRELTRTSVAPTLWTEADVEAARSKVGQIKRKGFVRLNERAVK